MDKRIVTYQKELTDLENKEVTCDKNIVRVKNKLKELKEESITGNNENNEEIENTGSKLKEFEEQHVMLERRISEKNKTINDLKKEKDELTKKCLMNLHSKMKKDHKKANEDHEKYMELYTKAREQKHLLERKMVNLKFLVYKNYNVRLN